MKCENVEECSLQKTNSILKEIQISFFDRALLSRNFYSDISNIINRAIASQQKKKNNLTT